MQRSSRGIGTLLKWGAAAAAVCLLVIAAAYLRARTPASGVPGSPSRQLPQGVSSTEYDAAAQALHDSTGAVPLRVDVISLLADRAAGRGDLKMAVACFREIPTEDPRYGRPARFQEGQLLVRLNRVKDAERCLKEFMKLESQSPRLGPKALLIAANWVRYLLSVQLRFEERQTLLEKMHQRGQLDAPWTLIFCFPNYNHWNVSDTVTDIENFLSEDPENYQLRVALGRYRIAEGRCEKARTILERCHRERPTDLAALAALLACLHETNQWKRFEAVLAQLPPLDESEPWLLTAMRGHGHNRARRYDKAARCFRQLIKQIPATAEAHLGLARSLLGLKQLSERSTALRKAKVISRIQSRLGAHNMHPDEVVHLIEIGEFCESIQLLKEANIVAGLAKQQAPKNARVQRLLSRLRKKPANP